MSMYSKGIHLNLLTSNLKQNIEKLVFVNIFTNISIYKYMYFRVLLL